ncbi:lipase 3-like [Leguminivora glycinivorella]|uniref:lipase 3-like n=1 Tax=Leguminivora glycinivorella TaxID=1035111 RepID=UPI0020103D4B|nr:lipase 3-like [Leguminivora glycinivorella]
MITLIVVLFCGTAVLVDAALGRSPHADEIEQLFQRPVNARISNSILIDAVLDVPLLVRKYRYPLEVHHVRTTDGYILGMHRIPHGRGRNNGADLDRPVVFLMHGLLSSSADWVLMGPGSAFAYVLADQGYDVWMGNARGNYYSRNHTILNPDTVPLFWNFSWDEIGNIDLPTMITYVLRHTGKERLHYIGHSQGTTAFFVMGSLRPEYNEKIISMHALAPVAYMAHSGSHLIKSISELSNPLYTLTRMVGIGEFLPNHKLVTWAGQVLCREKAISQPMCSNILFLLGGWNEDQHNATMVPVKLGHTPAGASVKQFAHYGQSMSEGQFRRFDHGSLLGNILLYGTPQPPRYDLSKVTSPVFLHYSPSDALADVRDVDRLFAELGRPVGKFRIPDDRFGHLDFIWGIDANKIVYERVINLLRAMDVHG